MDGHVNDTLDEREEMGTMDAYKSRYSGQDKGTMDERDHMDAHTQYIHTYQWMKETTWTHTHLLDIQSTCTCTCISLLTFIGFFVSCR